MCTHFLDGKVHALSNYFCNCASIFCKCALTLRAIETDAIIYVRRAYYFDKLQLFISYAKSSMFTVNEVNLICIYNVCLTMNVLMCCAVHNYNN